MITGSSRGLGRGIAIKPAKLGAKVAVHYYQNEAAASIQTEQARVWGKEPDVRTSICCGIESWRYQLP